MQSRSPRTSTTSARAAAPLHKPLNPVRCLPGSSALGTPASSSPARLMCMPGSAPLCLYRTRRNALLLRRQRSTQAPPPPPRPQRCHGAVHAQTRRVAARHRPRRQCGAAASALSWTCARRAAAMPRAGSCCATMQQLGGPPLWRVTRAEVAWGSGGTESMSCGARTGAHSRMRRRTRTLALANHLWTLLMWD